MSHATKALYALRIPSLVEYRQRDDSLRALIAFVSVPWWMASRAGVIPLYFQKSPMYHLRESMVLGEKGRG